MADHVYIFESLKSKVPRTARKVHIRRLHDILHLCLQRNDAPRARRAWCILARCKDTDWKSMWLLAVHLLDQNGGQRDEDAYEDVAFLRDIMMQQTAEQEIVLRELVLRLILSGRQQEALEELELYLPSFPYQDNSVLHVFAGMITLYLAQPPSCAQSGSSFNPTLLRHAQRYFERAKALDPQNVHALTYLDQIPTFAQTKPGLNHDSEEEITTDEDHRPKRRTKA